MENLKEIYECFSELKNIASDFGDLTGEYDIYTNSKVYEIVIANYFNHDIVKGHSNTFDAISHGKLMEYKHFKRSSSNYTWTFNDYSDKTLERLKKADVYFVFIDDEELNLIDSMKWFYMVPGKVIAEYILKKSKTLSNNRAMINISPRQLETFLHVEKIPCHPGDTGKYADFIFGIKEAISQLENITGTYNLLTSNKIWELVLAMELGHKINSHKGGINGEYDAFLYNNLYEYKISSGNNSWTFEDLSEKVFDRLNRMHRIVVAKIDKCNFSVIQYYFLDPHKTCRY